MLAVRVRELQAELNSVQSALNCPSKPAHNKHKQGLRVVESCCEYLSSMTMISFKSIRSGCVTELLSTALSRISAGLSINRSAFYRLRPKLLTGVPSSAYNVSLQVFTVKSERTDRVQLRLIPHVALSVF